MGPVIAETSIDAPRERIFELISDLAVRPAFCDHFQHEFRLQRIDSTGVGAAARFHLRAPLFRIWAETVLAEVEAPHMVLERGKGARLDRMPIGTAWELVEGAGGMCDVAVSFWTEPDHAVDKLKDRLAPDGWYERQWRRALARLREIVESGAAAEPLRVAGASRP